MLKLGVRQQHVADKSQPEHASRHHDHFHDRENMAKPFGVPIFLLSAVNISFVFSCPNSTPVVPLKRRRSVMEASMDSFDHVVVLRDGTQGSIISDERGVHVQQLAVSQRLFSEIDMDSPADSFPATSSSTSHAGSGEMFADLFSSAPGACSDDTESFGFSSQGSHLPLCQDTCPVVASALLSSVDLQSMNALVDRALRSLICAKPIRTAPGLRTETSTLKARLTDIAPSTFIPGYTKAVAVRGPLVPIVARFLASFLHRSKSPLVNAKKEALVQQSSKLQHAENSEWASQSQDEEMKLKRSVKTHLWMTVTNKLRDPEAARRLKPLQPIAKSDTAQSDDMLNIERTTIRESSDLEELSEFEMLPEDPSACSWLMCHNAADEDEMLGVDDDDETEDYESDLFEAYEERLRECLENENGSALEPVPADDADPIEQSSAPSEATCDLISPMPGMPHKFLREGLAEQQIGTLPAPILEASSAATPADASATADIGRDVDWRSLLDEGSTTQLPDTKVNRAAFEPNSLPEDAWEPDFEQWEFDVEQGSDEMLF